MATKGRKDPPAPSGAGTLAISPLVLAAVFAAGLAHGQDPVKDSAGPMPCALEWRGVLGLRGSPLRFQIIDRETGQSGWFGKNEGAGGFVVRRYDAERGIVFVEQYGQLFALSLPDAKTTAGPTVARSIMRSRAPASASILLPGSGPEAEIPIQESGRFPR